MNELLKLPNVGKVLGEYLVEIGIDSPEKLRQAGAKAVFLKIRAEKDSGACLHMLYGIQGAIEGIHDKDLSDSVKQDLKQFYKTL